MRLPLCMPELALPELLSPIGKSTPTTIKAMENRHAVGQV